MLSLGLSIRVRSLGGRAIKRLLVTDSVPKFSNGVSSFKDIVEKKLFYVDKTSYIRKLEMAGNLLKIWRPRRFGKTLVCNMLEEYYDAANSKEKVIYINQENKCL